MSQKKTLGTLLVGIVAAMLATGCSSTPKQSLAAGADPTAELQKTKSDIEQAQTSLVNVLASDDYEKAVTYYEDASKELSTGGKNERIVEDIEKSRGLLARATQSAELTRKLFPQAIAARNATVEMKGNELKKDQFQSADKDFKSESANVISSKTFNGTDKEDATIANKYRDVQISTAEFLYIDKANDTLQTADKAGARKFAPDTREQYSSHITAAENEVKKDPTNAAGLGALSAKLLAEGQSLVQITKQSETIKNARPEEVSLQIEKLKAMEAARQQNLQEKLQATSAEAATGRELQAQRDAFERAKARFSPNEASVLQDGPNIIIRLKNLKFAKNEASLVGSQMGLLKKVQETIKDTKPLAKITIEGNTDSSGSKALNQKLSKERADVIAGYLDSSMTANAEVQTVGQGDQNPIAPNNTSAGRQANRRVDIILTPATSTTL